MKSRIKSSWFITGTDTEIGKTWCTLALIDYVKKFGLITGNDEQKTDDKAQSSLTVAGMKPIASGCYYNNNGDLRNSDAEQILHLSDLKIPYEWVNPYAFEPPIAPHLAAQQIGQVIKIEKIIEHYQQLAQLADCVVIEGVGGWRVPLNAQQSLKDMVLALKIPVILVVGLRLGCINHALLTAETIEHDGCQLVGWIANPLTPNYDIQSTIDTLSTRLTVPLLAQMPYLKALQIEQLTTALPWSPKRSFVSGQ